VQSDGARRVKCEQGASSLRPNFALLVVAAIAGAFVGPKGVVDCGWWVGGVLLSVVSPPFWGQRTTTTTTRTTATTTTIAGS